MKALRMALTGVVLTAMVTVGVIYWVGQDTTAGPSDPGASDRFIYAEVLGIDLANRKLTIEQHLADARDEAVGDTVMLAPGVEVYANTSSGEVRSALDALRVGHSVGMSLNADGTVSLIVYDELEMGTGGRIVPADPRIGEAFIEGKILAFDRANLTLMLDQHFADAQTVDVGGVVEVLPGVQVRRQNDDGDQVIDLDYLEAGQVVGMILDVEGKVRAIIVDNLTVGGIEDVEEVIVPCNPAQGEMFVHARVEGVNYETLVMTIDQHLEDARTVDLGGEVAILDDVIIRRLVDGHPVTPMTLGQLKAGDIVGMIVDSGGLVRAILVD